MDRNRKYFIGKKDFVLIKFILLITAVIMLKGCSSHKEYTDTYIPESPDYMKKIALGIDFFASGNEPYWSLDMDTDDSARIFIFGESILRYKVTAPIIDTAIKKITYKFDDNITLIIKVETCTNTMSDERNEFSAELRFREKVYTGCGKYIISMKNPLLSKETIRLNDIWALKSINGKELNRKDFPKGIPVLELHLNDGRFLGNTDCNEISGHLEAGNSYIKFGNITQTKIFCEGSFESEYLSALITVDSWRINKLQLSLLSKGKEILTFMKVD